MSNESHVTTVPLRPLVSAEYPERVHVPEDQNAKHYGSHNKSWFSTITAPLVKPPPGLEWVSLGLWKSILLLVGWIVYLLLGASIFMKLAEEYYEGDIPHPDWKTFRELLGATEETEGILDLNIDLKGSLEVKENIMKMCNHTFLNQTFPFELTDGEIKENGTNRSNQRWRLLTDLDNVERACKESLLSVGWHVEYEAVPTFIDAVHYTMTALTTIGYGHICPINTRGRMICVFYCLFGIPLTFILLNSFAELLAIKLLHTYKRATAHHPHLNDYLPYIVTALLIMMGFKVFLLLPSIAFTYIEGWSYSGSFYYSFVTLSTIGFGDMYAGFYNDYNDKHPFDTVYKLIIIIWVMTSLGYWLLVIKFVMKASKTSTGESSKTFSPQVITEQATAFRDLVWKVRNQNADKTITNGMNVHPSRSSMVEIMNDVEGARSVEYNDEQPIIARQSKNEFTDEEPNQPLSLIELLGVKVVIRNDDASLMKNIVSQTAKEDGELSETDKIPDEITLPLRDALNLVFSYQQ